MRSGSSLLSHLLLSNEQVSGLGESNAVYENDADLWRLVLKCQLKKKNLSKEQYYLDQVNHNEKTPNHHLLIQQDARIIFLIRNPENAVVSILKLTKDYYTPWTQEMAEEYLINRYKGLMTLSDFLPKECCTWVEYEELTHNSESELKRLSRFLSLKKPLGQEYDTFWFSGQHGDPSDQLLSGKINQKTGNKSKLTISGKCIKKYEQCLSTARGEQIY